jgi:hypothetical protein
MSLIHLSNEDLLSNTSITTPSKHKACELGLEHFIRSHGSKQCGVIGRLARVWQRLVLGTVCIVEIFKMSQRS